VDSTSGAFAVGRATATGATARNSANSLIAGQTGAFWFYAAVGLVTLWFCWKFVPETKGRSLEQIEAIFKRRAGEKP
jgi:H+/Cl- antiporter ClcA